MTVAGSIIAGNTAATYGGGIENSGTLTITGTAIIGNTVAGDGGGIFNDSAKNVQLFISNSLIDGNSAISGGGIENAGAMTAVNITITGNQADAAGIGGGLNDAGGATTLDNTIVALNTKGAATASDIDGPVSSAGAFNMIGTGGSGGLTDGDNGNQVGVGYPGLGPPGVSGEAFVVPLLPGSPAIDSGSNALAVNPATGQPLTTEARRGSRVFSTEPSTSARTKFNRPPSSASRLMGASGSAPLQTAADGLRLLPAGRNTDLPWLGIN